MVGIANACCYEHISCFLRYSNVIILLHFPGYIVIFPTLLSRALPPPNTCDSFQTNSKIIQGEISVSIILYYIYISFRSIIPPNTTLTHLPILNHIQHQPHSCTNIRITHQSCLELRNSHRHRLIIRMADANIYTLDTHTFCFFLCLTVELFSH